MKSGKIVIAFFIMVISLFSCRKQEKTSDTNIIFLHHSTGRIIWGAKTSLLTKVAWRFNKLYDFVGRKADLPRMFDEYNEEHGKDYQITKKPFPKTRPYGWHNYPYDYYNIWVKHAGEDPYMKEPTLEMLTKDYQVIIFKHCYPTSNIKADSGPPNIDSDYKSIANYKLQYEAIKKKLHEFPETKFILFTGAALLKAHVPEDAAIRAREFFEWVRSEWDQAGDNIYLWDLYSLQTEGGLYFKEEYAVSPNDSHPNEDFAANNSKLLFNRIIDVIENDGNGTKLTGELK